MGKALLCRLRLDSESKGIIVAGINRGRERYNLNLKPLTFEMLLLRCHHLMRGRFTHRTSHFGSREAVLRRGDAVRQSLTRHLPSLAESNALIPV